jgi:hypothetical protein
MCKNEDCKKYPSFNMLGKKAEYCFEHKIIGMIDVKNKKCKFEDCKTQPTYNIEGEPKAEYCFKHKKLGMINVISKTCKFKDCKKQPIYNIEGTKAEYCFKHKKLGMINVISKTCKFKDCKKQPNFNMLGKKAEYCFEHKTIGMIDVNHTTCNFEDCKTQPNYNFEGEPKALYCSKHKKLEMVDVNHNTCVEPNCKTLPTYNIEGKPEALYCLKHKKEGMIDVHHKTCKTPLCFTQVQKKYDGYCLYCFINTFPDKPVVRNYKTKEFAVVEHIKSKYPEFTWREDKKVQDGCSKRRPDLLLDLGYQIIIIEIDENQHIDYDCSCENKRIMELSQDLAHRPIIFIRFNPDDYLCEENTVSSCWGNNKNGICVVKKTKQKEWTERLTTLEKQIDYWVNPDNMTDKTIEIIQLFYDI